MRAGIAISCMLLLACGGNSGAGGAPDAGNDNRDGGTGDGDALTAFCGNGELDGEEACDDGEQNSDETPDACRTDCTEARCGDLVTDSDEGCDDGLYNSDEPNGACRTNCQPAGCGDGILDSAEACDDGNTVGGDGCSDSCQFEVTCGSIAVNGHGLAMNAFFLGDTDWQLIQSQYAWELFGQDLDGLTTTGTDTTGHCAPSAGANPADVFPDGPGGLDNSFGRNVLPILLGLYFDLSQQINAGIANGQISLLMLLEPILDPNQASVIGNVYVGAPLAAPPLWNGTDCWPVRQEDLNDPGNIASARAQYLDGFLTSDRWESGGTATVVLRLDFGGLILPLNIYQARISVQLDATHTSGTEGIIAGVIDTEELVEHLRDAAGSSDPSLCQGAAFDSLANQIRRTSDILQDGTQDPATTCNAITIGLGFTLSTVRLGEIAPPAVPPVDPCP